MIQGEDGKRMSKRHGATGVGEYEEQGILPEALLNYLVRLGWSLGDEEIFSKSDLIKNFKEGNFNSSPSAFSFEKLSWYNKHYLDQINDQDLIELIDEEYFSDDDYSLNVIRLIRSRCNSITDFALESRYFFEAPKDFEEKDIKKASSEMTRKLLEEFKTSIQTLSKWNSEEINIIIQNIVSNYELGFAKIGLPLRLSLTGTLNSPSVDAVCEILGPEEVVKRINYAQLKCEGF